jgi:hypothetical protein
MLIKVLYIYVRKFKRLGTAVEPKLRLQVIQHINFGLH